MTARAILLLILFAPVALAQNMAAFMQDEEASQSAAAAPWYLSGGVSASACVAAFTAKGAASEASSYNSLVGSTTVSDSDGGTGVGWTTTNGWVFVAANKSALRLNGYFPGSNTTIIVKFSGWTVKAAICGLLEFTPTRYFLIDGSGAGGKTRYAHGDTAVTGSASSPTSGYLAMTTDTGYLNGTADASPLTGSYSSSGAFALRIGARLNVAVLGTQEFSTINISGLAVYNSTLTQAQIQAIGAAMP